MTTGRIACCLAVSLLLAGCAGDGGPTTCSVNTVVDLPLLPVWRPAVEARLNGTRVVLLLDTGAQISMITPTAAEHYGLVADPDRPPMWIRGVGGTEVAPVVTVHRLELGGGRARDLDLPVASSLKGSIGGLPVFGLFGADFLSNYDVDIDVPKRHLALHTLRGCGARILPFDGAFEVPFRLEDTAIVVDLKLNGVAVTAVLDTGAPRTLVKRSDAERIGVTREALSADRQVGRRVHDTFEEVDERVHRFRSLEIGAETMNNFPFNVADSEARYTLLGDDFLHFNRVWVSYPLRTLFIQPAVGNKMVQVR